MILRREMTVRCNSEGTVSTRRKRPSIRIRTTISPSCGSKWISLARSENARSMRLLTKRIVGALSPESIASCETCTGTMSGVEEPASRFISSMTPAVPSLP